VCSSYVTLGINCSMPQFPHISNGNGHNGVELDIRPLLQKYCYGSPSPVIFHGTWDLFLHALLCCHSWGVFWGQDSAEMLKSHIEYRPKHSTMGTYREGALVWCLPRSSLEAGRWHDESSCPGSVHSSHTAEWHQHWQVLGTMKKVLLIQSPNSSTALPPAQISNTL
jgi:hypothetical protein